jgi:hypothetical protein
MFANASEHVRGEQVRYEHVRCVMSDGDSGGWVPVEELGPSEHLQDPQLAQIMTMRPNATSLPAPASMGHPVGRLSRMLSVLVNSEQDATQVTPEAVSNWLPNS